ncbi:hypothetical protein AAMO2058_001386500 [Amorphochlora amoebiformis]
MFRDDDSNRTRMSGFVIKEKKELKTVSVKLLTGERVQIGVNSDTTLGSLKQTIESKLKIKKESQVLFLEKKALVKDSSLLSDLGVTPSSCELSLVISKTTLYIKTLTAREWKMNYDPQMTREELIQRVAGLSGYDQRCVRIIWKGRQSWYETDTLQSFNEREHGKRGEDVFFFKESGERFTVMHAVFRVTQV